MKRTIQSLFVCAALALSTNASAQFYSVGGHLSRISGGGVISNIGIHASGDYTFDEKTGVIGSLGYFLPHSSTSQLELNARNSFATPRTITVNSKDKLTGWQIGAMGKRFFVGEYDEEGFGLYGLFGLGFYSFTINSKLDDYDEGTYGNYERSEYEHESGSNFTFGLGLGAQIQTGSGVFFLEPTLNIPGNSDGDGNAVEVEIPTTLQINLGFRYLLQ